MTSYHKIAVVANDHLIAVAPAEDFYLDSIKMELLPVRRNKNGMLLSMAVHAVALAVMIWRPPLFAYPVIIENKIADKSELSTSVLTAPVLPKLNPAGRENSKPGTNGRGEPAQAPHIQPKRDFAGPQEIISALPNAVNHIQSILRPDLPKPANLKFPLQLNTMMLSRSSAVPLLAPQKTPASPAPITDRSLVIETKSAPNKITNTTRQLSARRAEALPPPSLPTKDRAKELNALAAMNSNSQQTVLVVNAVSVPPDASDRIPDGQLAGSFTVGPSPAPGSSETKPEGSGKTQLLTIEPHPEAHAALPLAATGAGTDPTKRSSGTAGEKNSNSAVGGGNSVHDGSSSAVLGTLTNNAPAAGKGAGGSAGISISGGVPDRNRGTNNSAIPSSRSYGLTVISGGSSGGASRDVGFFNRTETVFSVVIPMSDAGGGPDWPMQYALLNREQRAGGLPSPPLATKKVAARMSRQQLPFDNSPLFVAAVIDENGKLTNLRALRFGDARSPYAISALNQWEFLPAQLEGRPVACKILIGITIIALE